MSDLRKAAEQYIRPGTVVSVDIETTAILVDLLRQALAQREWVGLTDEEIKEISFSLPIKWTGHLQGASSIYDFARAIEAKLKEKNT